METSLFLVLVACAWSGCSADDAGGAGGGEDADVVWDAGDSGAGDGALDTARGLPVLHEADPDRASQGEDLLFDGGLTQPNIPMQAFRNLWLVWGTTKPANDAEMWEEFNARYGTISAEAGAVPLGVVVEGDSAAVSCLACHADRVAGDVVIGVGNSMLDLQALYDDLVKLQELARQQGLPTPEVPEEMDVRTGAAGANDAFGLGMGLSTLYGPGDADINTEFGFQQAPAWWTMRHRNRIYTDGSGQTRGYRTMMATALAYGMSLSELRELDDEFEDVHHYILSLEAPEWPFDLPDAETARRGKAVYDEHCASCHGVNEGPGAGYGDHIEPVGTLGTDARRVNAFTDTEAEWVNQSWFGRDYPMQATDGYLAPPLISVWATAPYFHNGSVPDLKSVLDSASRPSAWRRTGRGLEDYSPDTVGWKYEVVDDPPGTSTVEGRRVYDTTRPGLGAAGHTYGDALSGEERSSLLEYLKTL